MIENPKVGQRVWWKITRTGDVLAGTVTAAMDRAVAVDVDGHGPAILASAKDLYDSPASAASALRAEAQRLLDAADKLESEARHDAE